MLCRRIWGCCGGTRIKGRGWRQRHTIRWTGPVKRIPLNRRRGCDTAYKNEEAKDGENLDYAHRTLGNYFDAPERFACPGFCQETLNLWAVTLAPPERFACPGFCQETLNLWAVTLAPPERFELSTSGFEVHHSVQLSYEGGTGLFYHTPNKPVVAGRDPPLQKISQNTTFLE